MTMSRFLNQRTEGLIGEYESAAKIKFDLVRIPVSKCSAYCEES